MASLEGNSPVCPAGAKRDTKCSASEATFAALTQRRNLNANDVEPIVQILPKGARPHRRLAERHRCGEHLHVDGDPGGPRPGALSAPWRTPVV